MSNADIARYSRRFVQLFWDPQPANDITPTAPIWCLGRRYDPRPLFHEPAPVTTSIASATATATNHSETPAPTPHTPVRKPQFDTRTNSTGFEHVRKEDVADASAINGIDDGWPADFLDDFESRIWLTYRSNFPPIPKSQEPDAAAAMSFAVRVKSQLSQKSGFTSDTGWGCMIRSGQSLLANALVLLTLGRDWRISPHEQPDERKILSLFADDPQAPFSIHRFVEHGAAACGTYPGQWFGPSATSKCIEALCNTHEETGLRVYVTGDGTDVFEDKLFQIAKDEAGGAFRPTLLLVGTRLGIDRITPVYQDALIASLMMPQSVGIAGGRPSSSHYFIGAQDRSLFYLDPHQTRPALPYHSRPEAYTDEEIASCHTRRLRRLPIEEMDPSMLIAFLFRSEDEWTAWRTAVAQAPGKHIFHVRDSAAGSDAGGPGVERESAVDEVETLDDCDGDGEGDGIEGQSEGWVETEEPVDEADAVLEETGRHSLDSPSAKPAKDKDKIISMA